MDNYIYLIDDFLFICTVLLLLYLFILSVASHTKHIVYPPTTRQYRAIFLIPAGSTLPESYREKYEFLTYSDLYQSINELDAKQYDLVIILSDKARSLSPQFLPKIYNAFDAGIQAIQLHTIAENRKGLRNRFQAIYSEIGNSLFQSGSTQLNLSSKLGGTNMAIDLKWLQKNLKSSKTNIERKLFKQNIYIDYLSDVIVYCESIPPYPYRKRFWKMSSYLLPSILERNWCFCHRIVQQFILSPCKLCIFVAIWSVLITAYDWTLSLGWWVLLGSLLITYSLAIPDYLVEDKKKKRDSIWRKRDSKNE